MHVALSRVKRRRADWQRVLARMAEYRKAWQNMLTVGATKKHKPVLLRMEIMDVFRPAAKAILLKQQQMDQRVILCD